MCDFRVLTQNHDGYIVYCPDCRIIQMAYGTILTRLQVAHFAVLKEHIAVECDYRDEADDSIAKNIFIPIDEGMMYCLTSAELFRLDELIASAAAVFETYQILQQS